RGFTLRPGKKGAKLKNCRSLSEKRVQMKPKTATASFRLDESALEALQEDAKKQNVSVNTLINQLILTYANYDRPMKRFHMVKVSGSTFRHILQAAKEETIIGAGNLAGSDGPRTSILAQSGELTAENALTYLKTMGTYSSLFEYSEVMHGGKVSVTLTHDFGPNGSLFLQEYVQAIFGPIGKRPKFQADEHAVLFELE